MQRDIQTICYTVLRYKGKYMKYPKIFPIQLDIDMYIYLYTKKRTNMHVCLDTNLNMCNIMQALSMYNWIYLNMCKIAPTLSVYT